MLFLETVNRFRIIARQQKQQLYRTSEHLEKFSEIENAHAKRDMYSREIKQYTKDRSF